MRYVLIFLVFMGAAKSYAGNYHIGGNITSLLASAEDPAIRLEGNVSPSDCDGGNHGWMYFKGTPQERQWIYSTALAMSLAGKKVTVYTNSDGTKCRIRNIQITKGLN